MEVEEMTQRINLAARLEESLKGLGGRFKVETVDRDWLAANNLEIIAPDIDKRRIYGVECIDERQLAPFGSIPRSSLKFPGASLGSAVLEAVETRRSVNHILHQRLDAGQSVFLHDDTHHERKWPTGGNQSGCGANDHLPEIAARFLVLTEKMPEDEAIKLARQLIGDQTGGDRTRELVKAGAIIAATYSGEHTGRRLVVNTLAGKTLDHLDPDGPRSFVVDAGSDPDPVEMAKLAAATVDVLLPPEIKIELAILR
jgi:hypothetical protein